MAPKLGKGLLKTFTVHAAAWKGWHLFWTIHSSGLCADDFCNIFRNFEEHFYAMTQKKDLYNPHENGVHTQWCHLSFCKELSTVTEWNGHQTEIDHGVAALCNWFESHTYSSGQYVSLHNKMTVKSQTNVYFDILCILTDMVDT